MLIAGFFGAIVQSCGIYTNELGKTLTLLQLLFIHMSGTESVQNWEVRVEDNTVVVELPEDIKLDQQTGEKINEQFFAATGQTHVESVLTLLRVEEPLSSGLFDEVQRGADKAAANGVTRWAIYVQEKIKGMAFESNIEGLETKVFENEQRARDWVDQ